MGLFVKEARRFAATNLAFGLSTLAVSAIVWWEASKVRPSPYDPLGAGAFPKLVSVLLAGLAILLIARVLLGYAIGASDTSLISGLTDDGDETHRRRPFLAVGVLAGLTLYIAALTLTSVGFLWATIVFVAVIGFAMSDRRPRDLVVAGLIALFIGVALNFLFTRVLIVALP